MGWHVGKASGAARLERKNQECLIPVRKTNISSVFRKAVGVAAAASIIAMSPVTAIASSQSQADVMPTWTCNEDQGQQQSICSANKGFLPLPTDPNAVFVNRGKENKGLMIESIVMAGTYVEYNILYGYIDSGQYYVSEGNVYFPVDYSNASQVNAAIGLNDNFISALQKEIMIGYDAATTAAQEAVLRQAEAANSYINSNSKMLPQNNNPPSNAQTNNTNNASNTSTAAKGQQLTTGNSASTNSTDSSLPTSASSNAPQGTTNQTVSQEPATQLTQGDNNAYVAPDNRMGKQTTQNSNSLITAKMQTTQIPSLNLNISMQPDASNPYNLSIAITPAVLLATNSQYSINTVINGAPPGMSIEVNTNAPHQPVTQQVNESAAVGQATLYGINMVPGASYQISASMAYQLIDNATGRVYNETATATSDYTAPPAGSSAIVSRLMQGKPISFAILMPSNSSNSMQNAVIGNLVYQPTSGTISVDKLLTVTASSDTENVSAQNVAVNTSANVKVVITPTRSISISALKYQYLQMIINRLTGVHAEVESFGNPTLETLFKSYDPGMEAFESGILMGNGYLGKGAEMFVGSLVKGEAPALLILNPIGFATGSSLTIAAGEANSYTMTGKPMNINETITTAAAGGDSGSIIANFAQAGSTSAGVVKYVAGTMGDLYAAGFASGSLASAVIGLLFPSVWSSNSGATAQTSSTQGGQGTQANLPQQLSQTIREAYQIITNQAYLDFLLSRGMDSGVATMELGSITYNIWGLTAKGCMSTSRYRDHRLRYPIFILPLLRAL